MTELPQALLTMDAFGVPPPDFGRCDLGSQLPGSISETSDLRTGSNETFGDPGLLSARTVLPVIGQSQGCRSPLEHPFGSYRIRGIPRIASANLDNV